MYEVPMTNEQLKQHTTPHIALEALREQMRDKLNQDEELPEWYDITVTNDNDGFKITAIPNAEKKKRFTNNLV